MEVVDREKGTRKTKVENDAGKKNKNFQFLVKKKSIFGDNLRQFNQICSQLRVENVFSFKICLHSFTAILRF